MSQRYLGTLLVYALGVISVICLANPQPALAFGTGAEGCGSNCQACHSITNTEVQRMVRRFDADAQVVSVDPAPVKGLYQAILKRGNEEGIIYIDFGKKHVLAGRIYDAGSGTEMKQETAHEGRRIDVSSLPLEDALLLGNRNGTRKLYLFTDPDCPFCAKLHGEIVQLVKEDPRLLVYILLYPLDIHPDAARKVDSIICTSRNDMEAGLGLLEKSFSGKEVPSPTCTDSPSSRSKKVAERLGIAMTPSLILPDGRIVAGFKKKEEISTLIAETSK